MEETADKPEQQTPVAATPLQQPPKKLLSTPVIAFAGIGILAILALTAFMLLQPKEVPTPLTPEQPTPARELTLTLDSPADQTLAVQDEILISGTTTPGATVAVYTEEDEVIVETDPAGRFETTVTLVPGINSLNINAFLPEGQEKSVSLTIVYDDEQQ